MLCTIGSATSILDGWLQPTAVIIAVFSLSLHCVYAIAHPMHCKNCEAVSGDSSKHNICVLFTWKYNWIWTIVTDIRYFPHYFSFTDTHPLVQNEYPKVIPAFGKNMSPVCKCDSTSNCRYENPFGDIRMSQRIFFDRFNLMALPALWSVCCHPAEKTQTHHVMCSKHTHFKCHSWAWLATPVVHECK